MQKKGSPYIYFGLLPVLLSIALITGLYLFPPVLVIFEPHYLLPLFNTILFLAAGVIAYLAWRSYLLSGSRNIFWLGCGVLCLGAGALAAGWLIYPFGPNANVTIFNVAVLLASICHAVGVLAGLDERPHQNDRGRRLRHLTLAYPGVVMAVALLVALTLTGVMPAFFLQGQGPTHLRQLVVEWAIILLAFSSLVMLHRFFRRRAAFFFWYSQALALVAAAMLAFLLQRAVGSPTGWVGRSSYVLAAVYFFLAVRAALREARTRGVALDKALAQLFEPELYWQEIMGTVSDAVVSYDDRRRILLWNKASARIFGYPEAGVLGRDLYQVLPCTQAIDIPALAGRITEMELKRQDGSRIQAEVSISSKDSALGLITTLIIRDVTARKRAEDHLTADFLALSQLHSISTHLLREDDLHSLLEKILTAAIGITKADMGTIQLLDPAANSLKICASLGFSQPFLDFFAAVTGGLGACGESMDQGERLVIEDVAQSPVFAGRPALEVIQDAGVAAVQSTPIISRTGDLLGIISTHWRRVHRPEAHVLRLVDLLAGQAAELIERNRAEEALRESEKHYRSLFDNMLNGFAYCRMIFEQDQPVDFIYLNVNHAFAALTGLQDVVGKKVSEVIPGILESDPHLFEIYGRVALTGKPEQFESYVAALDMWFSIAVYSPQKEYFVGVFEIITDRKRAEEALRESEARFHTLANAIPQLAWIADSEGSTRWYNQRWYDYTGKTAEEMEGWGWQSVHDPQVLPAVLERWRNSLATGSPFDMVFPIRGADGQFRQFLTRVFPLKDAAGRVLQWFGTNTDVTERQHAEEALRRSHQRLDLLADMASQLLASVAPQQAVDAICHQAMEYLGCDAFFNFLVDEKEGRLHLNACAGIPAAEAQRIQWLDYGTAVCGCAARDGCRIVTEDILHRDDPRTGLVKSYGIQAYACHPLMVEGRVLGTLSFGARHRAHFSIDDLSLMKAVADQVAIAMDRKLAEEALRKSEERLLLAQAAARIGTFEWNIQTGFNTWTHQLEEMYGLPPGGFGRTQPAWGDLVHPDDRAEAVRLVEESLITGEPQEGEWRVVWPDGSIHWLAGRWQVFKDESGRPQRMTGVNIDITERKRAEEALRQLNEELEQRVAARTGELTHTVAQLEEEMRDRGQAEKALATERQRFFDVLENLPAMVCLLKPEYRVVFGNRYFREIFGEVQPDRPCYEWVFGQDHPCEPCHSFDPLKTGAPGQWEVALQDGRLLRIYDYPFRDTDGSPMVLEMGIDITEQMRVEKQIRAVSTYARSLIEASLDPLVTISPAGRITDVNLATEEATGIPREQLIGSRFSSYFTDPGQAEKGYQQVLAEGLVRDYYLTLRHLSGRVMDVLYNASVYKNEAGEVAGVFAAARDITERKRAEEALSKERQRFYEVLEMLPAYVVLLAPDYHVPFANRYFVERFGESHGRRCYEYLFGRSEPCEVCETFKVLKTSSPQHWEWTGPDGRHYDIHDYPFTDVDGSPLIMEMGIDITERKRAEEEIKNLNLDLENRVKERTSQLEFAIKELEAFSYSVSHDLKSPLRAISGFSAMLAGEHAAALDQEGLRLLGIIRENSEKMGQLIEDLLNLSHLGRQEMKSDDLDLSGMVESIFRELQEQNPDRRLKLQINPLPRARGDHGLIRQVLINLLGNAIKFTRGRETGEIEVGGCAQGPENIFYVKDNGVGFDMRYTNKLFSVFQTLHNRREFEGTGVGLALVQRIIRRHGGRVWAESKVEEGATFYFTLPAVSNN